MKIILSLTTLVVLAGFFYLFLFDSSQKLPDEDGIAELQVAINVKNSTTKNGDKETAAKTNVEAKKHEKKPDGDGFVVPIKEEEQTVSDNKSVTTKKTDAKEGAAVVADLDEIQRQLYQGTLDWLHGLNKERFGQHRLDHLSLLKSLDLSGQDLEDDHLEKLKNLLSLELLGLKYEINSVLA